MTSRKRPVTLMTKQLETTCKWQRCLLVWYFILESLQLETTATADNNDTSIFFGSDSSQCGLYLAESTIPGAGLGVFTGIAHSQGDPVLDGDITIPLFEIKWHNGQELNPKELFFLWDDYAWGASDSLSGMGHEILGDRSNLRFASPGAGSAPNAGVRMLLSRETVLQTYNIEDGGHEQLGNAGLHRRRDPGVGAFTPYHDRDWRASKHMEAGQELLVNYGQTYFETRPALAQAVHDYYISEPENLNIRGVSWLQKHGKCMDNIRPGGQSTIQQAGRGAFARRFIPKGGLVSPLPLIHIPDRSVLIMYRPMDAEATRRRNSSAPFHRQLITNYCFGHANSTILLCPYGTWSSLINHSRERPNARIVWAEDMQHPEWMKLEPHALEGERRNGLEFDVVALRDVHEGEEIFIDYGATWHAAWERHVLTWRQPAGAEHYIPAFELNGNSDLVVRTIYEAPYPGVRVYVGELHLRLSGLHVMSSAKWAHVLDRYASQSSGEILYMAETFLIKNDDKRKTTNIFLREILFGIPRAAFSFSDTPYSRDHALSTSFRHEMMIPDDIFPDAWKNVPD